MGLFDRLKKTREQKALEKAAEAREKEAEAKKAAKRGAAASDAAPAAGTATKTATKKPAAKTREAHTPRVSDGTRAHILIKPWVSEKAAGHASDGTYVFHVPMEANKVEIRKAVESQWRVNVADVRTARGKGKVFGSRARRGSRADWKKAFVTLAKGQSIDIYEGV